MTIESLMSHVMGRPARVILPPPEPQALPAELLAPVYDCVPLTDFERAGGQRDGLPEPYPADPAVFGVPLRQDEVYAGDHLVGGRCGRCGAGQADGAAPLLVLRTGGEVKPYYADELVSLYHGDCREVTEWLAADMLVTDPPYGRGWKQGETRLRDRNGNRTRRGTSDRHEGIAGDKDTAVRDAALAMWGDRCGVVFGDPLIDRPVGVKQALGYRKPADGGNKGTFGGFLRDLELIYLTGPWPAGLNGRSSILASGARNIGNPVGLAARYGHSHAKPVDVMETLISACPPGIIADPFAGSGSTLVAARNLGRQAVGVEIEEQYCEKAGRRLSQATLTAI